MFTQFQWRLSVLHSLRWYFFKDGFGITYPLVSYIMMASISFMKFILPFWTNEPIINIRYILISSVLLLDTALVRPTWNKKFQQVDIAFNSKVLQKFFSYLNHNNVMRQKYISSHGQSTEPHVTAFLTSKFFASSNTTVKNMNMFVYSITGQIQFQFSVSLRNRETQFPYNDNYMLCNVNFKS